MTSAFLIYFKEISNLLSHQRATKTAEINKLKSALGTKIAAPEERFENAMERSYHEFSSHFEGDYWGQDMGNLMKPDFFSQYKERSDLGLKERLMVLCGQLDIVEMQTELAAADRVQYLWRTGQVERDINIVRDRKKDLEEVLGAMEQNFTDTEVRVIASQMQSNQINIKLNVERQAFEDIKAKTEQIIAEITKEKDEMGRQKEEIHNDSGWTAVKIDKLHKTKEYYRKLYTKLQKEDKLTPLIEKAKAAIKKYDDVIAAVVAFVDDKNSKKFPKHINASAEVEAGLVDDMSPRRGLQRRRTSVEMPGTSFSTGRRRTSGFGTFLVAHSPMRSGFAGVSGRSGMGKSGFAEDSFGKFQEIVKKKTDFILKNRGILTSEHISQVVAFDSLQSEKIHKIKKRLKLEQKAVKKRILFQEQLFIKAQERQKALQQKQMIRNKTTLFKVRSGGIKGSGVENRPAPSGKDMG